MGGNLKEAGLARQRRQREKKQERLRQELEDGEWMHLTLSIDSEVYELWVKSNEPDSAVRLFAQDFLSKDYVRELRPNTRFGEVKRRLSNAEWVTNVRKNMPDPE